MLGHGIFLVISPYLFLVTVDPRMRREARLSSVSHFTNVAHSGVVSSGSEMTGAQAGHPAVREQAPGEVGAGQEGAEGGAALLHHLDPEPDPLALILHDLVDARGQPTVRCGRVEGGEMVMWPVPGPVFRQIQILEAWKTTEAILEMDVEEVEVNTCPEPWTRFFQFSMKY